MNYNSQYIAIFVFVYSNILLGCSTHRSHPEVQNTKSVEEILNVMAASEWADCANSFFHIADMLLSEGDENTSKIMSLRGNEAALACIMKMRLEGSVTKEDGYTSCRLSKALDVDPRITAMIPIPVDQTLKDRHREKANEWGVKAYVEHYASKCSGPSLDFSNYLEKALY